MLPRTTDLTQFPVSFAPPVTILELSTEQAESNSPPLVKTITTHFHSIYTNILRLTRPVTLRVLCIFFREINF